jgi:hypothetical protein
MGGVLVCPSYGYGGYIIWIQKDATLHMKFKG